MSRRHLRRLCTRPATHVIAALAFTASAAANHGPGTSGGGTSTVWVGEDEDDGAENDASGGTTMYLAPGFRARINSTIAFSVAPAFPVHQDVNGDQVETDAKVAAALSFSF